MSRDGNTLYFVSDMPGGYGKTDLWYCEKGTDGSWLAPKNCGNAVNTAEDEAFPTIGSKGEMYFASTGHEGMGGYDIFVTNGNRAQWQRPENMKAPINSSYDDFYLSARDDKSGYLSSNRTGGKGSDDIYAFKLLPPKVFVLKTILINKKDNNRIIGGDITLKDVSLQSYAAKQSDKNGANDFILSKVTAM